MENNNIEIISVSDCLKKNLAIPAYQRPYKWSVQNISDLLFDIKHAISEKKLYANFKYRIGTIILHKEGNVMQVVDGQQRMISLTLLNSYLDVAFNNSILGTTFIDASSLYHIHQNYQHIKEWFSLRDETEKTEFINAMTEILEVVVIYVEKESEAFQLFDSQNTRGRTLDPHDLLKAYHLREMKSDAYDMEFAVNKWEMKNVAKIRELFCDYLFPIWNWSRKRKTWTFTNKDIDTYKGISANCSYTFAQRTYKAMPCFQITEPFIAGKDFFDMVDHYLRLIEYLERELKNNLILPDICSYFDDKPCSVGMKHVKRLYKAALLLYYDRFHMLDPLAMKKLFMWAFMLRIEIDTLSYDSINKYAVGNGIYNSLPIFAIISQARKHTEIGNLVIQVPNEVNFNHCKEERNNLYNLMTNLK